MHDSRVIWQSSAPRPHKGCLCAHAKPGNPREEQGTHQCAIGYQGAELKENVGRIYLMDQSLAHAAASVCWTAT